MVAFRTVISLRFEANGEHVGYLMVDTLEIETAQAVARRWALKTQTFAFDAIVMHQGVMNAPFEHGEEFEGYRIWELPF